jgi:hypothetical protein
MSMQDSASSLPCRKVILGMKASILALASLLLTACDQWALSIGGNGLVFVAVIGDNQGPPGRYRVRTRQAGAVRVLEVPASGQLDLSGFDAGPIELTLLLPEGCRVSGPNPRTLMVSGDQPVSAAFDVRCGG